METKKGFTLVELLITLGLSCIIISLTMSFFINNLKNYKYINNNTELQFQAQYILNFMSNKILLSKHIELVKENTSSYIKRENEQKITKISFRYGINSNQCYNFEIKNNKIYYGNSYSFSTPTDELGCYVKEVKVAPINGKSFEFTKSLIISITLEKDDQQYEIEQTINMRNFDKDI